MIPFPKKKYDVIYCDPPWRYNARNGDGTRFGLGVHGHYNTMSMRDLMELPIDNIAKENCALFLWCPFPRLSEALDLMRWWGFSYKTVGFTWVKTNKRNLKPFFGIGYYTKSNAEVCLLGMRGKMKPVSNKVSSVIISPRREHSRKPDEARKGIEKLFGKRARLEMFAREKAKGWDSWGDEV